MVFPRQRKSELDNDTLWVACDVEEGARLSLTSCKTEERQRVLAEGIRADRADFLLRKSSDGFDSQDRDLSFRVTVKGGIPNFRSDRCTCHAEAIPCCLSGTAATNGNEPGKTGDYEWVYGQTVPQGICEHICRAGIYLKLTPNPVPLSLAKTILPISTQAQAHRLVLSEAFRHHSQRLIHTVHPWLALLSVDPPHRHDSGR
eukprot:1334456-Amorphochlora_amoeboformis.AAC.1